MASFTLNLTPLILASMGPQQPRVPVFADELWISASPNASHESYHVAAQARERGRQEIESSVTAVHATTGQPLVYASGLVFKTLPGFQESSVSSQHGSYNIDWRVDPTFLNEDEASKLFEYPWLRMMTLLAG